MYNEIIDVEETETATTNFKKKHAICKTNNFYILLAFFLLITIMELIAVSIYCYLKQYKLKKKNLLPQYVTKYKSINEKLINVL